MRYCIGCGKVIDPPKDLQDISCQACSCGAHVSYNEKDTLFLPQCMGRFLEAWHKPGPEVPLPHLDCLVGTSNFSSLMKTAFITFIEGLGGTWRKDCEVCRRHSAPLSEEDRGLAVEEVERIIRRK